MNTENGTLRAPADHASDRLRAILDEMAAAAREDAAPEAFFRRWLSGVTAGVGCDGAAIFETVGDGFRPLARLGALGEPPESSEEFLRREQTRRESVFGGRAVWLPRHEPLRPVDGVADGEPRVCIAPLPTTIDGVSRLAELYFRSDAPPGVRRAATRFLQEAATHVDTYELRRRHRASAQRQAAWDAAMDFNRAVHVQLETKPSAYAIVNEGRRFLGCDRAGLLLRRGRTYRVAAVSGQDVFDPRSPVLKALSALVARVCASHAPLRSDAPAGLLSPQLEDSLARYIDESQAKSVAVLPLYESCEPAAEKSRNLQPCGALVVERLTSTTVDAGYEERERFVVERASAALTCALRYERIFLLPLWVGLGRAWRICLAPGTRWKTAVVAATVALTAVALALMPADFTLHADATFQPVERREVFAPSDGTVERLYARHGDRVAAGAPLIDLRNTELEVATTEALGERTAVAEQLAAAERALYGEGKQLAADERVRLAGQRAELKQRLRALEEKLLLLEQKKRRLRITSPVTGEILTWDVDRTLADRPVRQGQALLTVADSTSDWELEVYVPERYVGKMARARKAADAPLTVRFRPTADPHVEYVGTLKEIHGTAEVRGERGNTVLATVAFDARAVPALKAGTEAVVKIHCGRRSLGYVWFHEVVDFVRSKILFRLN